MRVRDRMAIAIHHRRGSFSDRWIEYCKERGVHYEVVNCHQSDIVERLRSFDALLWHWHQNDAKAILFARQLIASLQNMNICVFPNIGTCWHFDDKVGQKYLLESIGAPLVPSYVFYDKEDALKWIEQAAFPKVFKLRVGAGSCNVRLVRSRREARVLCRQAFGRGFPAVAGYLADMRTRLRKTKSRTQFWDKLRRVPKTIGHSLALRYQMPRQKEYLYFQDFLPDNSYDTRLVIIGNRCFGLRRYCRKGDFRASGSGLLDYTPSAIDLRCIEIAFDVARKIRSQSVAFDFLSDGCSHPRIGELSYGFPVGPFLEDCPGHWDKDLNWHEGKMWPQDAILEDVLERIRSGSTRGLHEASPVPSLRGSSVRAGWQGL